MPRDTNKQQTTLLNHPTANSCFRITTVTVVLW